MLSAIFFLFLNKQQRLPLLLQRVNCSPPFARLESTFVCLKPEIEKNKNVILCID